MFCTNFKRSAAFLLKIKLEKSKMATKMADLL